MDDHLFDVLKEIQSLCEINDICKQELCGVIVKTNTEHESQWCYRTNLFMLLASPSEEDEEEDEYHLSFSINNYTVQSVAYYTHLITLVCGTALLIDDDHFVDHKNQTVLFGTNAYNKFEEYVHEQKGFVKCPLCERYVPKDIFYPEKGYCKICEDVELPVTVFH